MTIRIQQLLQQATAEAMESLYDATIAPKEVMIQETRSEFIGDFTIVVFPLAKLSRKNPKQTAEELGAYMQQNVAPVQSFEIVQGFLNLLLSDSFWYEYLIGLSNEGADAWEQTEQPQKIMLEYSSPNTNKPLHLGHIRNNLLGYSVAEILKARGHQVIKTSLTNDRGIHICKSMLAYLKLGHGETPESCGMKGDHLVGKYYVEFDKAYKRELQDIYQMAWEKYEEQTKHIPHALGKEEKTIQIIAASVFALTYFLQQNYKDAAEVIEDADEFRRVLEARMMAKSRKVLDADDQKLFSEIFEELKNASPLMLETQEMLRKWEAGDPETMKLWETMNGWVYKGFDETYKTLGVNFDRLYFESQTYILGKNIVREGLEEGVFFRKDDGSVWIDLKEEGLDEKLVLRGDGTSVYITQDIGTAQERFDEYSLDRIIYTVGNEQEYHFKVLREILKKMGRKWWDSIYHLSYGMVELPSGKMKSREGTVVDADDLIAAMIADAEIITREKGMIETLNENEIKELVRKLGLAALKFFILKTDPKKQMLFDPAESIDLNGFTGPYNQYTYTRTRSVRNKCMDAGLYLRMEQTPDVAMQPVERELLKMLYRRDMVLQDAELNLSPALLANYAFELSKTYNKFYHDCPIMREEDAKVRAFRLKLSEKTGEWIRESLALLGIEMPEKM